MLASLRHSSLFAAALALAAPACMTGAADPNDPATVQAALEQPNGGETTTDEAPLFGADTDFATAAIEPTAAAVDPAAQDPSVIEMTAQATAAHLRVAIVWGHLPPDRTITTATDWSGAIALSRGALVVRHTIGFEPLTGDHLLPRPDLRTVAFASHTRPFADGLMLEVVDPTPGATDPLTLTYTPASGGAPITYAVADLVAGPVSVDVGGGGDRMVALALHDADCEHGFLRGRWRAFRDGLGGFLGVVASADGDPIGHVRGIWGVKKDGEHVFFGKYIALDGTFRGILAGHYGDDGHFVGRWLDRAGEHGKVEGRFHAAQGDAGAGHFLGRWAESACAQELPNP